jgi:hypothetical protein
MRDVAKRLRGADFRQAVQAVAALRHMDPASRARLVPSLGVQDEQRAFQLLIARPVVDGGVSGLAARWRDLPSPHWREELLTELGQCLSLWVEDPTISRGRRRSSPQRKASSPAHRSNESSTSRRASWT